MRLVFHISLALALATLVPAQDGWKDRAEYDIAVDVRNAASPTERLAALDQWSAKYPNSTHKQERRELYLSIYAAQGDRKRLMAVAADMLKDDPGSFLGAYWYTIALPDQTGLTPETLTIGESAAKRLLEKLDADYSNVAVAAKADETAQQKALGEFSARRALGWIYWQRGDYAGAERELTLALNKDPRAETAYWLALVQALQKQPSKTVSSLWTMLWASSNRTATALPDAERRAASTLSESLYIAYHGSVEGLEELRAKAAAFPLPPVGFKIESTAEIAERREEEELLHTHPELAAWHKVKKAVEAKEAPTRLPAIKATVVRLVPEENPTELGLAVEGDLEDLIVMVDPAFAGTTDKGTVLQIGAGGLVSTTSSNPFKITISIERDKIEGWPDPNQRR